MSKEPFDIETLTDRHSSMPTLAGADLVVF